MSYYLYKGENIDNLLVAGTTGEDYPYNTPTSNIGRLYKLNNFNDKFDIYQNGLGYNVSGSAKNFLPKYHYIIPSKVRDEFSNDSDIIPYWCNKIKCIIIAKGGGVFNNEYENSYYAGAGSAGVFEYIIPSGYTRSSIYIKSYGFYTTIEPNNGHTGIELIYNDTRFAYLYLPNGSYGDNRPGNGGNVSNISKVGFTDISSFSGQDGNVDRGSSALCGFVNNSVYHDNLGFGPDFYGKGNYRNLYHNGSYPPSNENTGYIRLYFLT